MDAMSYIDESYLEQSEKEKTRFSWKPLLAFAAVFSLVMAVFINMPGMGSGGSSAPAFNSSVDSAGAVSPEESTEETVTEGIADQVQYDDDLLAYLDTVSSETMVSVSVEVSADAEYELQISDGDVLNEKGADEILQMTKDEILNFEPEPGVTYIFHLYNADDME